MHSRPRIRCSAHVSSGLHAAVWMAQRAAAGDRVVADDACPLRWQAEQGVRLPYRSVAFPNAASQPCALPLYRIAPCNHAALMMA